MLTANTTVAIRRGLVGDWTELADRAAGLGAWNATDTARTRPIPSIPAILVVQRLTVHDATASFTADDNMLTAPLMFMRSGEIFQVRIRKEGDGLGRSEAIYTGPARINLDNVEGGARSYQFALTATGLTRGIQLAAENAPPPPTVAVSESVPETDRLETRAL